MQKSAEKNYYENVNVNKVLKKIYYCRKIPKNSNNAEQCKKIQLMQNNSINAKKFRKIQFMQKMSKKFNLCKKKN
jgi:hypothetical protein